MDQDILHIFFPNIDVTKHNTDMLNKLSKVERIEAQQDLPKGRNSIIDEKKGTIGNTEFPETLKIAIGARCMVIYNLDVIDDLCNGQCGTIVGIEKNAKGMVYCIVVQFDDPKCGKLQRERHEKMSMKYKAENGTPMYKVEHEFQLASRRGWAHSAKAKLRQFPLRLCYAQTAHKSQVNTIF